MRFAYQLFRPYDQDVMTTAKHTLQWQLHPPYTQKHMPTDCTDKDQAIERVLFSHAGLSVEELTRYGITLPWINESMDNTLENL